MPQDFHFLKFYENTLEFPQNRKFFEFLCSGIHLNNRLASIIEIFLFIKATGHSPKMYDVYFFVPCLITAGKDA